jgi:hypothetical protein
MYQIFDPADIFQHLVFSTIDKAREYATKYFTEDGSIGDDDRMFQWESLSDMEWAGAVVFSEMYLDPEDFG